MIEEKKFIKDFPSITKEELLTDELMEKIEGGDKQPSSSEGEGCDKCTEDCKVTSS